MSQDNTEPHAITETENEVDVTVSDEPIREGDDAFASDEHEGVIVAPPMPLSPEKLQRVIEGALLASGQPLNLARILSLFEESEAPTKEDVHLAVDAIMANCEGRGFELKEVASGWRFQVREETATWVNRLYDEKPQKYSRALLETLALIAYRQPITRGDIEDIRGVAVSSHIIKTLTEREWVKVVGHRDVPGRPALYATTRLFLDYFNLKSLDELPSLGEISDLESLNPELELELDNALLRAVNADLTVDAGGAGDDSDDEVDDQITNENTENEQTGDSELSVTESVADEATGRPTFFTD